VKFTRFKLHTIWSRTKQHFCLHYSTLLHYDSMISMCNCEVQCTIVYYCVLHLSVNLFCLFLVHHVRFCFVYECTHNVIFFFEGRKPSFFPFLFHSPPLSLHPRKSYLHTFMEIKILNAALALTCLKHSSKKC